MRIRPDAKQAQVNLGIVKQESGDLTGAREAYERALKIAPDQGDVIYNLASVIEQQGQKEEAERMYVKLLSRNPDWEDAWFRLGYLRLARNDYRGGAEAFHACVKKRAAWPEAQLNLGLCNWNLGDRDGAAKAFEAVLASDPKSIDALRGLAALAVERGIWIKLSTCRRSSSKPASALRSCSITPACCCRNPARWKMQSASIRKLFRTVPTSPKRFSTWDTP